MSRIHVSLPDGPELTHELTDDVITVGRVSDNAIQIEDISVSSHHGEFIRHGEEYAIKDIGSTNGSRLNGQVLEEGAETPLHHGDELILGSVHVKYLSAVGSEQPPLPQESEPALAVATTSVAPTDFSNASPFQKKGDQRDPKAMAVLALGILALLSAGGAIFMVLQMKSPL